MAEYIIDGAILGDIAEAIRTQTGEAEPITPEAMAEKVAAIGVKEYEVWKITYLNGTVEEAKVVLL